MRSGTVLFDGPIDEAVAALRASAE